MRGPIAILKYLIGSVIGNGMNLIRAGNNSFVWGIVGGIIVGAVVGSMVVPGAGTAIGLFIGGLLGATVKYALS